MLSPGDKVKDYEVIAPLGSGGMATLYLARRRGVGGFSRLLTLKLVHQHLAEDESVIQLFLAEARICAHVAHPNVVHVEEVGHYDGSYFIAMEYVHGVSLAELLARLSERRQRLRRKLCVWLAAQVAEALHAAHEARGEDGAALDIVHRDVSPQNVLIAHTGHVKLIDFGIAKSQAEVDHRSRARPVLGKLRYMSPEQLRLERADRRADVYALGVMLWEMLAGRNLLRCQRFNDERDWATRENPPPPSRYAGHSPPALDAVVLKAIACEASERYASAFEFRSALLRVDPEAVQIDAPLVAALMRSLLGDELQRRRANLPREIVAELDATPGVTISRQWSLDELTDGLAPRSAADVASELGVALDDEPTVATHYASETGVCRDDEQTIALPSPVRGRRDAGRAAARFALALRGQLGAWARAQLRVRARLSRLRARAGRRAQTALRASLRTLANCLPARASWPATSFALRAASASAYALRVTLMAAVRYVGVRALSWSHAALALLRAHASLRRALAPSPKRNAPVLAARPALATAAHPSQSALDTLRARALPIRPPEPVTVSRPGATVVGWICLAFSASVGALVASAPADQSPRRPLKAASDLDVAFPPDTLLARARPLDAERALAPKPLEREPNPEARVAEPAREPGALGKMVNAAAPRRDDFNFSTAGAPRERSARKQPNPYANRRGAAHIARSPGGLAAISGSKRRWNRLKSNDAGLRK